MSPGSANGDFVINNPVGSARQSVHAREEDDREDLTTKSSRSLPARIARNGVEGVLTWQAEQAFASLFLFFPLVVRSSRSSSSPLPLRFWRFLREDFLRMRVTPAMYRERGMTECNNVEKKDWKAGQSMRTGEPIDEIRGVDVKTSARGELAVGARGESVAASLIFLLISPTLASDLVDRFSSSHRLRVLLSRLSLHQRPRRSHPSSPYSRVCREEGCPRRRNPKRHERIDER
jgi:hypothetical protein